MARSPRLINPDFCSVLPKRRKEPGLHARPAVAHGLAGAAGAAASAFLVAFFLVA